MRRAIEVPRDHEGLMYDGERAEREGLYEELRITTEHGREIELSPELMDLILHQTDLGVNVGPDDEQVIGATITYRYDYGRVPEEVSA